MAPIVIKNGKAVSSAASQPQAVNSAISPAQKALFALAVVLVGPSLFLGLYEKLSADRVDLSDFNIVTSYDKPANEMMDGVLRIQFCASCNSNGHFRRAALELQRAFPDVPIEGGPFTPSAAVQRATRAVRVLQAGVGVSFFFGEQILAKLGRPPFEFMNEVPSNMMVHGGILYGLNCVTDMLKSINAFEIFYNGELVYSKVSSGQFPAPGELSRKLQSIKQKLHGKTGVQSR